VAAWSSFSATTEFLLHVKHHVKKLEKKTQKKTRLRHTRSGDITPFSLTDDIGLANYVRYLSYLANHSAKFGAELIKLNTLNKIKAYYTALDNFMV